MFFTFSKVTGSVSRRAGRLHQNIFLSKTTDFLSTKARQRLTNLRFPDDVLLFSTSLSELKEMLCDFKRSTEIPSKTKILSNQKSGKQKEVTIDNIKIEILQKSESARYLGLKSNVQRAGNGRNQEQTQISMGGVRQISPGTHLKIVPLMLQIAIVQHGDHANIDVREWNLDTVISARKNDQISATKNAWPPCPDEETLQSEDKERKGKRREASR